jgi:Flp pilus assembly protein TadD
MSVESHYERGREAYAKGDYPKAAFHFEKARAESAADDSMVLTELGNALKRAGQFEKAVAVHESLVRLLPAAPEALSNLATTYLAWGHTEAALANFQKAAALRPEDPELQFNLATAYQWQGDLHRAIERFEAAIALKPDHARAHTNLGVCYKNIGRIDDALAAQRRAVTIDPSNPDAEWNLALTEILTGAFEAGFARYEWRRKIKGFPSVGGYPWNGEALEDKTLVIFTEQGMGDALQFIRYLPLASKRAAHVTLMCRPSMVSFLKSAYHGAIRVVPMATVSPETPVAPLMSLPFLLRHGTWLGEAVPYLHASKHLIDYWSAILDTDGRLKVGLCWQGNPSHKNDRHRSIPLSQLLPLFCNREVRFFSLQKFHGLEQLSVLPSTFNVVELGSTLDESAAFADTAAVIHCMDIVLTVDTAIAHLAGALGRETWTLLPLVPDFRWGIEGRCAAYPSMRLFRQTTQGDWTSVVREVEIALLEAAIPARYGL